MAGVLVLESISSCRGRVIAIDTRKPAEADWVDVIPEQSETLEAWTSGCRFGLVI